MFMYYSHHRSSHIVHTTTAYAVKEFKERSAAMVSVRASHVDINFYVSPIFTFIAAFRYPLETHSLAVSH